MPKIHDEYFGRLYGPRRRLLFLSVLLLTSSPLLVNAQMAPIQLTNPAVDSVNGDKTAAWIADENLGVLYCELHQGENGGSKRVSCFDSNGAVNPAGNNIQRR